MQHYIEIYESDIENWHTVKAWLELDDVLPKYDAIVMQALLKDYINVRKEEEDSDD